MCFAVHAKLTLSTHFTPLANDILPVSDANQNYEFVLFFSDKNVSTGIPNTLGLPPETPTVKRSDLLQGLKASEEKDVSAPLRMTLPGAACAAANFLCACVGQGNGSSYKDADTSNNCYCIDIRLRKSCRPGTVQVKSVSPYFHIQYSH